VAATDALLEIVYRPDVIDEQSLERARSGSSWPDTSAPALRPRQDSTA
jgi:hypothetical protein